MYDFYVYRPGKIAILTSEDPGSYDLGINVIDPYKKATRLALVGMLPAQLNGVIFHCLLTPNLGCLRYWIGAGAFRKECRHFEARQPKFATNVLCRYMNDENYQTSVTHYEYRSLSQELSFLFIPERLAQRSPLP